MSKDTHNVASRIALLEHTADAVATKLESGSPVKVNGIFITGTNTTVDVIVSIQDTAGNDIFIYHPFDADAGNQISEMHISIEVPFIAHNGIQTIVNNSTTEFADLNTTILYNNLGG